MACTSLHVANVFFKTVYKIKAVKVGPTCGGFNPAFYEELFFRALICTVVLQLNASLEKGFVYCILRA